MPKKGTFLQLPADRPRLSRLIAFAIGVLFTASFAPFGIWILPPLLLLPLLHVCFTVSPRDAGAHLFWFGFGLFLSGTYWIYISVVVFGQAAWWIAVVLLLGLVVIMSAWLWLTGWLTGRLCRGEAWLLLAVAPAVWVLVEWLRGWLFSGFPWLAIGYSQIDSPLAGWAPILGVYGVSFMAVLSATAVQVMLLTRGRQRMLALGIVLLPWLAGGILGTIDWTEPAGPPIRSTIVQAGIPQDQKWLPETLKPTLAFYRNASVKASDSDLVVWPEVAIPSVTDRMEAYFAQLGEDSRQTGQTLLFGILERVEERGVEHVFNSVMLIAGDRRQFYRKRHLVPFGEYFPVPSRVREWMRMQNLPHSDLSAGHAVQPLLRTTDGVALAAAICYEDAYGAEQLYAFPEAALLINVSNDAWFGNSIAPHQHLEIARMRSLEVGRPSIRATNTGVSAFIDPKGDIIEAGPQFEPAVLTAGIQPQTGATPFVAAGNTPIVVLCLLLTALARFRGHPSA